MRIHEIEAVKALKKLRDFQEAHESAHSCGCGNCRYCLAIDLCLDGPLAELEEYVRITAKDRWVGSWSAVIKGMPL